MVVVVDDALAVAVVAVVVADVPVYFRELRVLKP